MSHIKRVLKALLLVLGFSLLCACTAPVLQQEQAGGLKRIGVVSLLPGELAYDKIGITVFNNEFATRPVGDGFNVAARDAAGRFLLARHKTVVQLPVDVAPLAQRMRSAVIVWDSSAEAIRPELVELARRHRLDAIVLIAENHDGDQGRRGVRAFLRAGMGDIRAAEARADIKVLVLDPNARLIAWQADRGVSALTRADGAPWAYQLESNLDEPTHVEAATTMLRLIRNTVASQLSTMGF